MNVWQRYSPSERFSQAFGHWSVSKFSGNMSELPFWSDMLKFCDDEAAARKLWSRRKQTNNTRIKQAAQRRHAKRTS